METQQRSRTAVIDLTLPIRPGWVMPATETVFETLCTIEELGFLGTVLHMFIHAGTHVDSPAHYLRDGVGIDEVPLSSLMGRARVFDLTATGPSEAIEPSDLREADPGVQSGDIAILHTGWTDTCWGEDRFLPESPYLTEEATQWLVDKGIKAVAMDFSADYCTRNEKMHGDDAVVHKLLLKHEIWTIEFITGVDAIDGDAVTLIALPMKLEGLDAGPTRVIALPDGIEAAR